MVARRAIGIGSCDDGDCDAHASSTTMIANNSRGSTAMMSDAMTMVHTVESRGDGDAYDTRLQ